jgi:hypothetical protein
LLNFLKNIIEWNKKMNKLTKFLFSLAMLALLAGCSANKSTVSETDRSSLSVSATKTSETEIEASKMETSEVVEEADSDGSGGVLPGCYWIANDGSYLCLNGDGTFMYYQSVDNKQNYYSGTYDAYCGMAAVNYIAEDLSEYGLTKEEQTDFFGKSDGHNEDNYYCLILYNDELIIDGQNNLAEQKVTPYYGFYDEENTYLDMVNMDTANYAGFTKTEKQ